MDSLKQCTKCKEWKPLDAYQKNPSQKSGLQPRCRICRAEDSRRYISVPENKEKRDRYEQERKGDPHHIEVKRKYEQTEKRKRYVKEYTHKAEVKQRKRLRLRELKEQGRLDKYIDRYKEKTGEANRVYHRKFRQLHKDKKSAHEAVRRAIKRGVLLKANTLKCSSCPNQAQEYHHHNGYDKAHWLDVVPICKKCHGLTRRID